MIIKDKLREMVHKRMKKDKKKSFFKKKTKVTQEVSDAIELAR